LKACAACMARLAPFGACCIKRQIKFPWNGDVHAPRLETLAGLSKSVTSLSDSTVAVVATYYFHYEVDGLRSPGLASCRPSKNQTLPHEPTKPHTKDFSAVAVAIFSNMEHRIVAMIASLSDAAPSSPLKPARQLLLSGCVGLANY
jgi:hypothetical protein